MSKKELQRYLCLITSLSILYTSSVYAVSKKDKNINKVSGTEYDCAQILSQPLTTNENIDTISINERETHEFIIFEPKVTHEEKMQAIIERGKLTYEEKMQVIIERDNLTYEELDAVLAGCVAESCGAGTNYDDAYAVASTIYNRTKSKAFASNGSSIYNQFIAPNQFSVYASGAYKLYLGGIDLVGYQAAIDMFYSEEVSHNYLCFRASWCEVAGSVQYAENGNHYFGELKKEDKLEPELVLERKIVSYVNQVK